MESYLIVLIMIFGILAVDFCARIVLTRVKDKKKYKSAGIIALLALSFQRGQPHYSDKEAALKQLFLSIMAVLFLTVANYFLLKKGMPQEVNAFQYSLLLTPLFVMPFFHFLYELLLIRPLCVDNVLHHFHCRAILSLILSSNVIFIAMEPLHNIISLLGHFVLALSAFLGVFYLCSELRKKSSTFSCFFNDQTNYLEASMIRYLASVMELFYYLLLLYFIFIKTPLENALPLFKNYVLLSLSTGSLLIISTIIVKYRFYLHAPISLGFYEERALPLSFLLFGIVTVVRLYSH